MGILNAKTITNLYLYGTESTPTDKTSETLIRPSGQDSGAKITVSTSDFMSAAGRFAVGAQFELIQRFFNDTTLITPKPDGTSYTKVEIAAKFGMSNDFGWNMFQTDWQDGTNDYAERVYIWNSMRFKISDEAEFIVNADGTREIKNFYVIPQPRGNSDTPDEDFNFIGSGLATVMNGPLESLVDPSGLGRTVGIEFDASHPTAVTYTREAFNADLANTVLWNDLALYNLVSDGAAMLNDMWNAGTTKLLDPLFRPIVYGTDDDNTMDALTWNWTGTVLDIRNVSEYIGNGVVLIGGKGNDVLTGHSGVDELRGGAGSDIYWVNWGGSMAHVIENAGDAGTDAIGVPDTVTTARYERVAGNDGQWLLKPQDGQTGAQYTIPTGVENVMYSGGGQVPVLDFPPHQDKSPEPFGPGYHPEAPIRNGIGAEAGWGGIGSPLVLDLDTYGVTYTNAHGAGSVYWDIDSDGFREQTSWIGPEDAFLSLDRNGNGVIDNNSELFGDQAASQIPNGFVLLKGLDTNGDNTITAADAQFSALTLWTDTNMDGVSQSTELSTLTARGVTSINLNYKNIYNSQGDAIIKQESRFIQNGVFRQIVDAWFAVDQVNSEYALPYTLTPAILAQPELRGYGQLPDLRIAMSQDPALLALVQGVSSKTLAQLMDPAFHLQDKMAQILFQWAGLQNVDPNSRGGLMDARMVGFIDTFLVEPSPRAEISAIALQFYMEAWHNLLDGMSAHLLMQRGLGGLYHNPVYDAVNDLFTGGDAQGGFNLHYNISAGTVNNPNEGLTNFRVETAGHDIYVFHPGDITALNGQYFELYQYGGGMGGDVILLSGFNPAGIKMWTENPYAGQGLKIALPTGEIIPVRLAYDTTGTFIASEIPRIVFDNGTIWDFHNGLTLNDTDDGHYIPGSDRHDTITAGGGDDVVHGYAGNDILNGGTGVDTLWGELGDDTYIFKVGESLLASPDTILEYDGVGVDTIKLTGGILPANVTLNAVNSSFLEIQYSPTDKIWVYGDYTADEGGIERIVFDNGTVWDLRTPFVKTGTAGADEIHGTLLRESINGAGGNDTLYGEGGNDILNGAVGNDILYGGTGSDQYVYSASGHGTDIIRDESGLADMIVLGASFTPANISLVRVGTGDLAIKSGVTQLFLIEGQFNGNQQIIESLKYGDGTILNLLTYSHTLNGTAGDDLLYGVGSGGGNDILNGLDGNDTIYAVTGDDTVNGGNGNDTINGDEGDDTLSGNAGDDTVNGGTGNDTVIYESGADVFLDYGGTDVIKITNSAITSANMTLVHPAGNMSDLDVRFNGAHAFTIQWQFSNGNNFETIQFANGSTFNLSTVQYTGNGTAGDDTLYGISSGGNPNDILKGNAGNDTIYAMDGNDSLTGGTGNDTLDGGNGDDTYFYNAGDGLDTISDAGGTDVIQLGAGFVKTDLTWAREGGTETLQLFLKGVQAFALNTHFAQSGAIETIKFSDGTTQALTGFQITTNGTAGDDYLGAVTTNTSPHNIINGLGGNDTLYGWNGNDVITGGTGNDALYGNVGNDTYKYNLGDGVDTISDAGGTDIIQLGAGFVKADLTWARVAGTNDLLLKLKGVDTMTIQNHFGTGYAGGYVIETVKFADGTTTALNALALTTNGTVGPDVMYGTDASNDLLNGKAGDDYIVGYAGNDTLNGGTGVDTLFGGLGNDIYVFRKGESPFTTGVERIFETAGEGVDTIKLTGGVLPATVLMWTDSYDFVIQYSATDKIVFSGGRDPATGANTASSVVERVTFDNGTIWDLRNGLNMNDSDDGHNIIGSSKAESIDGKGGDDYIYGYAGADTLTGGTGYDILYGQLGDDTYVFRAGDSTTTDYIYEYMGEGVDTIKLTGGILPSDVRMWTDTYYSYTLNIQYSPTDKIVVQTYDPLTGNITVSDFVEKIAFDDGTVWDLRNGLPLTDSDDSHSLAGSVNPDVIDGRGGSDMIYGLEGDDTLTGGADMDYMYGGLGDDTYVLRAGDSPFNTNFETIFELANEGVDTIKLMGGILPSDVFLSNTSGQWYMRYTPTDQINMNGIERIAFDDGTIWDLTGPLTIADPDIDPENPEDHNIHGSQYADTIEGRDGWDRMYGDLGDDVYLFRAGDSTSGGDIVVEYAGQGIDTVKLVGILPSAVKLWGQSTSLISIIYSASDVIVVTEVEKIQFDNGTVWDLLNGNLTMIDADFGRALVGRNGNDTLQGNGGNDVIQGLGGNDILDGGAGTDLLYYTDAPSGVTVNLSLTTPQNTGGAGIDTVSNFENLTGSAFNDVLSGNAGNNVIDGLTGIDIVSYANASAGVRVDLGIIKAQNTVGAGTDTLKNIENIIASAFNDTLFGSVGNNTLEGGNGDDSINGWNGIDTVSYEHATAAVTVTLALTTAQSTVGAGTDTLSGFENLQGSAFSDTLTGDTNDNTIEGGAGNDLLSGGAGIDTASYEHATAAVTVSLALTTTQNTIGAGTDTLSGFEGVRGSAFNDRLTGDGAGNVLEGGAGNDILAGGAGLDTVVYSHAAGGVTVNLAAGTASGEGNDTLSAIENATGSDFNDLFTGTAGANVFDGRLGVDTVNYSNATAGVTLNLFSGTVTGFGADTLIGIENAVGSAFNDTITLNAQTKLIDGGLGLDTASFAQSAIGVLATLSDVSTTAPSSYGTDKLLNIENLTGSGLNDTLTGSAGVNILDGGAGNDLLYGKGGLDTLIGGLGADTFMFEPATAFGAPVTINDFTLSQGDKLDLSHILDIYDPVNQVVTDYIQMTTNGANTLVSVDTDGAGAGANWTHIATLNGITGLTDEATLIDQGRIVL